MVAKCPSVTKFVYTNGHGNTQTAISDIQGLVAQGINAIVDFPDAGEAMLPALTSAYKAGVVVVPYRVSPGGKAGVNYTAYESTPFQQAGVLWAKWVVQVLHGKGTFLFLGGPAANTQSLEESQGLQSFLKNYPNIKWLGPKPYTVTNWSPSQTQQVVAADLAKYPKIDAIASDFGSALAGTFPTFKSDGRQVPAVATEDSNQLACDWKKMQPADPGFKLFTVSSQNAEVQQAVQIAVAKASGGVVPSSTSYPQSAFENSVTGKPHSVECVPSMPANAFISAGMTQQQQIDSLNSKFDR